MSLFQPARQHIKSNILRQVSYMTTTKYRRLFEGLSSVFYL